MSIEWKLEKTDIDLNALFNLSYSFDNLKGLLTAVLKNQFTKKLQKEIFNDKIVDKLIEEKIIPKNSTAISLQAIITGIKYIFKKFTSKKEFTEDLTTIQNELILKVQNIFLNYDLGKIEMAKFFNKSLHYDSKIFVYGYSIDVIYALIYARKEGKS